MAGLMNGMALFAGAGGGILGEYLAGLRIVCAVEINAYAASVLIARQNDGILPPFPIWDDVRTFDGRPWRGIIDVVSGGFPCQDISCAGRGGGIGGEHSGLWKEMARIISEVRPRFVLVENSPILTSRGLGTVLGDLAALGYDAEWGVLGAIDAGAPHLRNRIWIVAYCYSESRRLLLPTWAESGKTYRCSEDVSNADREYENNSRYGASTFRRKRYPEAEISGDISDTGSLGTNGGWIEESSEGLSQKIERLCSGKFTCEQWLTEPDVGRVVNGVAARVDRLKALGEGQVPAVVRIAWEVLNEAIS